MDKRQGHGAFRCRDGSIFDVSNILISKYIILYYSIVSNYEINCCTETIFIYFKY